MSGINSNNIKLADNEAFQVQSNKGASVAQLFVNESQSSVEIVASDPNRVKVIITNESNRTMFLNYAGTAVRNEGIALGSGDTWVEEHYTGHINGVWSNNANDGARVFIIT